MNDPKDWPSVRQPLGWPDFALLPESSTMLVMVPPYSGDYTAIPVPGGPLYNPARPGPVAPPSEVHQITAYQLAWNVSKLEAYKDHWVALWCDYVPYAWCPVAFRNGENATRAYYADDVGGGWTAEEIEEMLAVGAEHSPGGAWCSDMYDKAGVPRP